MNVSEAMSNAIDDFLENVPEMAQHIESEENPHNVTKSQVGLSNVANTPQATKQEFDAHTARHDNPHAVTKSQVGLGNIENVRQATKQEFNSHVSGGALKHTADDIIYSGAVSVKDRIEQLVVEDAGGTVYHDELLHRDMADAHPIEAITGAGRVIVFEGITTDGVQTELLATPTPVGTYDPDVHYIDTNGRFHMPTGTAAAFELNVSAVTSENGEIRIEPGLASFYLKTCAMAAGTNGALIKLGDTQIQKTVLAEAETTPEFSIGNQVRALLLRATGLADTTLHWHAEIRLTNIFHV